MALNNIEASDLNDTKKDIDEDLSYIHFTISAVCALVICLVGLLANAVTFWFLCCRIPRTKYTVYIINLIFADFTYLFFNVVLMLLQINHFMGPFPYFPGLNQLILSLEIFYDAAYQAGMFFLLAISIERCLSVFFPIWYRCHRPKHQSLIVCLSLWVFSCLISFLDNLVCPPKSFSAGSVTCTGVQTMTFVLTIGISLPLMLLSSSILLMKIQKMSKRFRPPKLYIIIIASAFVFLIATVPVKFLWLLLYLKLLPNDFHSVGFFYASVFCTALSSSINPFIYFIVGRQKKRRLKGSIHSALHHVFHEEEEDETPVENGDSSADSHSAVISYIKT
ncbi:proto-oncogene Mas-like [Discoglossus pictus]